MPIPGSSRDAHTYTYSYPPVRVSRDSLVTVPIPGSSRDAHTYTYSYPPVRVSRDSLVTVTIPGSSRDAHTYTYSYPPVRVSRDSLVTVPIPGSSRDAHTYTYSYPRQSIPGFPSNCAYPGIIPGCTHIHNVILLPPVRVSRDSLVTVPIPGSSRDAHTYTMSYSYPLSECPGIP